MTWNSFFVAADDIFAGQLLTFNGQLLYLTDGTGLGQPNGYTLVVSTLTETEILDLWSDTALTVGVVAIVFQGDLYMTGLDEVTITPTYQRLAYIYNGTPNSWTQTADLTLATDTATASVFYTTINEANTRLISNLGIQTAPTDANEHVAYSSDGTNWTKTSITSVSIGLINFRPVTVRSADTYVLVTWTATGNERFAAFDGGAWTVNASEYAVAGTYTVVPQHWGGEGHGLPFTSLWLRRVADSALMRSTNGGTSIATTVTDGALTMTIASGERVIACGGYEFCVSSVDGSSKIWYFNGSVWVKVDSGVAPGTALRGIANVNGTLYMAMGSTIYTTSSGFGFVADDEFDPAPMNKPADVDADGGYVYIAALNNLGQPTLIKFPTALNADGTVVFEPGGGADIGVECSETNGDVVWVAGDFDGNNTVEKTENAGTSFVVKDPGTFQPVTAFKVGPVTDEIVLVATEASGSIGLVSIEETRNDGTAWSEKNAGLSAPARIRALDRLDINDAEIVLGNSTAATHRADYSPNTGDDLDDITTGTPAFNATGVIVG